METNKFNFLLVCACLFAGSISAQEFSLGFGVNYDVGLDFFSNEQYVSTESERISAVSAKVFAEIDHKDYHIYPSVFFSVSGGFVRAQNLEGDFVPQGVSFVVQTNPVLYPAEYYTERYTHLNADGKLSYFMGGLYITRTFFKNLELGTGVYLQNSKVEVVNFMASDHYHLIERENGQDRFRYILTLFSEEGTIEFSRNEIAVPIVASYLFDLNYFKFKPGLFLFLGEDLNLKANVSFAFPLNFLNKKTEEEPNSSLSN